LILLYEKRILKLRYWFMFHAYLLSFSIEQGAERCKNRIRLEAF